MASISFDPSTGWWSVRYYAGASKGRVKKPLCKHPGAWSKSRPPSSKRPPLEVRRLAEPFEEIERQAKAGMEPAQADTPLGPHVLAYIENYSRAHRENSTRCLRTVAEKFLAYCAARKVAAMQGVTPKLCAEWMEARLSEVKASTLRTERAYLATIWKVAKRRRVVREDPWEFAPLEAKPEEAAPKFWTTDELVTLISSLDGWLKDWVVLDANTGLRVSALLGLRWKDVDFPGNRIVVPPHLSKGRKAYHVPMTPTANEVLMRRLATAKKSGPEDFIFVNPKTGEPYLRRTVQARIERAVKRCGIRDFGHYCHAIRHSFAVALVEADVNIRVVQSLLGHASISTTEIYAKVAPGKAERIMNNFDISPDRPKPPSSDGTSSPPANPPS